MFRREVSQTNSGGKPQPSLCSFGQDIYTDLSSPLTEEKSVLASLKEHKDEEEDKSSIDSDSSTDDEVIVHPSTEDVSRFGRQDSLQVPQLPGLDKVDGNQHQGTTFEVFDEIDGPLGQEAFDEIDGPLGQAALDEVDGPLGQDYNDKETPHSGFSPVDGFDSINTDKDGQGAELLDCIRDLDFRNTRPGTDIADIHLNLPDALEMQTLPKRKQNTPKPLHLHLGDSSQPSSKATTLPRRRSSNQSNMSPKGKTRIRHRTSSSGQYRNSSPATSKKMSIDEGLTYTLMDTEKHKDQKLLKSLASKLVLPPDYLEQIRTFDHGKLRPVSTLTSSSKETENATSPKPTPRRTFNADVLKAIKTKVKKVPSHQSSQGNFAYRECLHGETMTEEQTRDKYYEYKIAEGAFQEAIALGESNRIAIAYKNWSKLASGTLTTWHPMVHAAQLQSFSMCKQLRDLGLPKLQEPHGNFCECELNKIDPLRHALYRVNAYRTMASPCYLITLEDPISEAFKLRRQLNWISEIEKEFKQAAYVPERDKCEVFICEMVNLVGGKDELAAILNKGEEVGEEMDETIVFDEFAGIKRAINDKAKQFIALPYVQRYISTAYYGNTDKERKYLAGAHNVLKLFCMVFGMPVLLMCHLLYLFLRPWEKKVRFIKKIGEFLSIPCIRFYSHTLSYIVFLILVTTSILDNGRHKDIPIYRMSHLYWIYLLILIYVIGFLFAEVKQIAIMGARRYFDSMFNWMDIIMIGCYLASFSCRLVANANTASARRWIHETGKEPPTHMQQYLLADRTLWDPWDPEIIADGLFSIANVISFSRLSYILPAFETLGPLLVTLGKMLRDIFRFMSLLCIVFAAFVVGIHNLFKTYVGNTATDSFTSITGTLKTLFWSLFGMGDADNISLTIDHGFIVFIGFLLYGAFHVMFVILLINMLIAMMTISFESIQEGKDIEWKFARTSLWIQYITMDQTIPVPLNLIPSLNTIITLGRWFLQMTCGRCNPGKDEIDAENEKNEKFIKTYMSVIGRLKERYLKKFNITDEDEVDSGDVQRQISEERKSVDSAPLLKTPCSNVGTDHCFLGFTDTHEHLHRRNTVGTGCRPGRRIRHRRNTSKASRIYHPKSAAAEFEHLRGKYKRTDSRVSSSASSPSSGNDAVSKSWDNLRSVSQVDEYMV